MQFVGVAGIGPGLLAHQRDRRGVERPEVPRRFDVDGAAHHHRLGAALFEGRVVEEGVRLRAQDFVRHRRRLDRVDRRRPQLAVLDAVQDVEERVDVHRLVEAVVDRLAHQGVIGDFDIADDVLGAGHLGGKDGGEEVAGAHPLNRRRDLLAALVAQDGQGAGGVPPPAHLEHGRGKEGLSQHLARRLRAQVVKDVVQREAVLRPQRQHDIVFGGGGLQLLVERAAELLAEGEAPGPVHPPAEGGVEHELHPAGLVEEAFEDDAPLRGNHAEGGLGRGEVLDGLLGGRVFDAGLGGEPSRSVFDTLEVGRLLGAEPPVDLGAQGGDLFGKLGGARRGLAEPEGNRRRLAVGVLDEHLTLRDLEDAPRRDAKLEDVAGHALDGEVFVDRADHDSLRLE